MSKRANKCLSVWSSIAVDNNTAVFKRYDAFHSLDFYLGVDSDGAKLLLFICADEPPAQPDMKGIRFKKFHREDGRWSLLLSLKDLKLSEIFSMLCQDLIDHSDGRDGYNGFYSVITRLGSWRRLLERNSTVILSHGEIRGLIGELSELKLLIDQLGAHAAVSSWNGPYGAPQDFSTDLWGCEVKAVRPAAEAVNVSSEHQLDFSKYPVFLVVFEVAELASASNMGISLGELVETLRKLLFVNLAVLDSFEERLLLAGYVDREEYFLENFLISPPSIYKVSDQFPAVQRQDLPAGVFGVKYKIELSAIEPFKIPRIVM